MADVQLSETGGTVTGPERPVRHYYSREKLISLRHQPIPLSLCPHLYDTGVLTFNSDGSVFETWSRKEKEATMAGVPAWSSKQSKKPATVPAAPAVVTADQWAQLAELREVWLDRVRSSSPDSFHSCEDPDDVEQGEVSRRDGQSQDDHLPTVGDLSTGDGVSAQKTPSEGDGVSAQEKLLKDNRLSTQEMHSKGDGVSAQEKLLKDRFSTQEMLSNSAGVSAQEKLLKHNRLCTQEMLSKDDGVSKEGSPRKDNRLLSDYTQEVFFGVDGLCKPESLFKGALLAAKENLRKDETYKPFSSDPSPVLGSETSRLGPHGHGGESVENSPAATQPGSGISCNCPSLARVLHEECCTEREGQPSGPGRFLTLQDNVASVRSSLATLKREYGLCSLYECPVHGCFPDQLMKSRCSFCSGEGGPDRDLAHSQIYFVSDKHPSGSHPDVDLNTKNMESASGSAGNAVELTEELSQEDKDALTKATSSLRGLKTRIEAAVKKMNKEAETNIQARIDIVEGSREDAERMLTAQAEHVHCLVDQYLHEQQELLKKEHPVQLQKFTSRRNKGRKFAHEATAIQKIVDSRLQRIVEHQDVKAAKTYDVKVLNKTFCTLQQKMPNMEVPLVTYKMAAPSLAPRDLQPLFGRLLVADSEGAVSLSFPGEGQASEGFANAAGIKKAEGSVSTQRSPAESVCTGQSPLDTISTEQGVAESFTTGQSPLDTISTEQGVSESFSTEQRPLDTISTEQGVAESFSTEQRPLDTISTEQGVAESFSTEQRPLEKIFQAFVGSSTSPASAKEELIRPKPETKEEKTAKMSSLSKSSSQLSVKKGSNVSLAVTPATSMRSLSSTPSAASSKESASAKTKKRTRTRKGKNKKKKASQGEDAKPNAITEPQDRLARPKPIDGRMQEPYGFAPLLGGRVAAVYAFDDPNLDVIRDDDKVLKSTRIGGNAVDVVSFSEDHLLVACLSPRRLRLMNARGESLQDIDLNFAPTCVGVGSTGIAVADRRSVCWMPLDGGRNQWVETTDSPLKDVCSCDVLVARGREVVCLADSEGHQVCFYQKVGGGDGETFSALPAFKHHVTLGGEGQGEQGAKTTPFTPISVSAHRLGFLAVLDAVSQSVVIVDFEKLQAVSVIRRSFLCQGEPSVIAFALTEPGEPPKLWVASSDSYPIYLAPLAYKY